MYESMDLPSVYHPINEDSVSRYYPNLLKVNVWLPMRWLYILALRLHQATIGGLMNGDGLADGDGDC